MKRTQVIKITPIKKKNFGNNSKGNKYFNKLSKNQIGHLLNFFNEEEQLKLFSLNSQFKSAFLFINEVDENEKKDWFKYTASLIKLNKDSKGFSPYLNVCLNINIINLIPKCFGINSDKFNKFNILKKIIEENYNETKLNKLLIQIKEPEDFNLYYSVLNLINKDLLQKLKFDIDISAKIDINPKIDNIKKLFTLISFKAIKPFNANNKKKLIEIQDYFISNNIKTIHKFIWSTKEASINNALKYSCINQNCLLGLNNPISAKLCFNNTESLKYINNHGYPIEQMDYLGLNLKKIKFDYPSEEFTKILLEKINFENLEQLSGLIISKDNINQFINKINTMKNLKKITRIKFGLTEEEEEDDNLKESLFQDFFNGIKVKHGNNLIEITTWWKRFKKGKDYEFILKNFPNVRKIQEDYDASGLYDMRIEINNIFSCNAEDEFKESDLKAITQMVNNYIKQKKEGDNSIKFDLYNNFARMEQLMNYWKENNENKILEKINYINFVVPDEDDKKKVLPLNKINAFNYKNDNFSLINSFKEVKVINQLFLDNDDSLEKIKNLFNDKDLISIVYKKNTLPENELSILKDIKSLKYFIFDENNIKLDSIKKEDYKFKFIPKQYFANTTEMS